MDLIFLILNYNTYQYTIDLCKEILAFNTSIEFRIVIVDNNSPNESYLELQKSMGQVNKVDVVKSSINQGYAKGNNVGLRFMAKYNPNFVCIINNDVKFDSKTIETLMEIYSELEKPAIIAPVQYLSDNTIAPISGIEHLPTFFDELRSYSIFHCLPAITYNKGKEKYGAQKVDIIPGAMFLIKFDIFSSLDFFDEDTFLYGEEKLLARKIKDKGLYNYVITSLKYLHLHSLTINREKSDFKQRLLMLKGKKIYISKYHKWSFLKNIILHLAFYYNYLCYRVIKRYIKK